jgi:hypothetical protein
VVDYEAGVRDNWLMEPISITIGAAVAALLAKAWERTLDATADAGQATLQRLADRVRQRFAQESDDHALRALELVEQVPDSELLTGRLAGAIDHHAGIDPEFASELETLVSETKAAGVYVGQIKQTVMGNHNIQIGNATGSQINLHRLDSRPPRTTES